MMGEVMGRPKLEIDADALLDMTDDGLTQKDIADEFGISTPTLAKRMAELEERKGMILKYRALQSLQLTALQARILESITPSKIEEATLRDLVMAYKILKTGELDIEGKPKEMKGLVAILVQMEKEESRLSDPDVADAEARAIEMVESREKSTEYIPQLTD